MVGVFMIFSALVTGGLLAAVMLLAKKENTVRTSIQALYSTAALAVIFNAISVISDVEIMATMSHGMYYAATDWMVLSLIVFAHRFTGEFKGEKADMKLWGFLTGLDTLSMLVNPWLHHVFRCENAKLGGTDFDSYVVAQTYSPYTMHLAVVYTMVAVALFLLVKAIIQTIPLYRVKYTASMAGVGVVVLLNVLYRFTELNLDISPIFYSMTAGILAFFSMYYVPRGVEIGLLTAAVKDMRSGVVCFDKDGKCVYFNEDARDFFLTKEGAAAWDGDRAGRPVEKEAVAAEHRDAQDNRTTDTRTSKVRHVRKLSERASIAQNKERLEGVLTDWSRDKEGELEKNLSWNENKELADGVHCYEVNYHPLKDSRGSFIGSCFAINDRTEEQRNFEREHFRATHDQLTGLYNREGFFERARQRLDAVKDVKWLVVCTDIKDFKLINDLFGVDTGDKILKHVAEIMRREKGPLSEFGRLSGDRFAMLIPKDRFGEELFEGFAKELCGLAENEVYRMHIHIGVYPVENRKIDVSVMCDRAFSAIQSIKNDYQRIIAYYDTGLGNQQIAEKRMLAEFDSALQSGQFRMFLQPQIGATQGEKLLGAEALVRWTHPIQGMISPGVFIPVLEQAGLIYKLDYYIWETACARLKKWKEQGRDDLHISVNISQKDFYFMDLYQTFTKLVEKYGISPEKLKLEITETALMSDLKQQLGLLERLRQYGFHIEIDDFGSGYSSLNTLKDIEVDVLKLDMGFLSATVHEDRSKTIMNSIISMSKQLGLTVITEGVETFEQVLYLKGAGCDMFQGYYFAKPMAVENFEERYLGGAL